jgi:predicted ATP-dependent serine protease|tara:strand:- start:81 stop:374 length:294 start_codon:yes stop_codon:yes gene_type:complete
MAKFLKLNVDGNVLGPKLLNISNVNFAFISAMGSTQVDVFISNKLVYAGETPFVVKLEGGVKEAQQLIDTIYEAKTSSLTNNIFEITNAPTVVSITF